MTGRIQRLEDFIAWQKARVLTKAIYQASDDGRFSRDFALKDQFRRAAISVMSNIAEGYERGKPSEFHQFLCIAKASCAEIRSQLYIGLDAGYLAQPPFDSLMNQAKEVGQLLGALRASVERRRDAQK